MQDFKTILNSLPRPKPYDPSEALFGHAAVARYLGIEVNEVPAELRRRKLRVPRLVTFEYFDKSDFAEAGYGERS